MLLLLLRLLLTACLPAGTERLSEPDVRTAQSLRRPGQTSKSNRTHGQACTRKGRTTGARYFCLRVAWRRQWSGCVRSRFLKRALPSFPLPFFFLFFLRLTCASSFLLLPQMSHEQRALVAEAEQLDHVIVPALHARIEQAASSLRVVIQEHKSLLKPRFEYREATKLIRSTAVGLLSFASVTTTATTTTTLLCGGGCEVALTCAW